MAPGPADHVVERLRSLCGHAMTTLPASGAGLSVVSTDRQYSLLTAADPASERLEELQFVLGEGPCVDAATSRRPVLVSDLGREGPLRWPAYASAMDEAGVSAVFAFPLQIGAAQLGVLDFFRTRPGDLSGPELTRAFALADAAVAILLDKHDRSAEAPGPDGMPVGPSELFQAQGMVMIQIGGTLAEAMSRIRAYAYAENRRLIDVARDVVSRRVRFDADRKRLDEAP
jgi:GAF domain-containing protein